MKMPIIVAALLFAMPAWVFAQNDILTTAASNGSFKTLTSLVVAADLDDALQGKGALTVFAPTDEAFAKLPEGTLETLLKPENREQLASILKYHVLPQKISVPKRNSHPIKSAKTLLGKDVPFERNGTKVKVGGANITARNIKCTNGLIHVIDAVLLPPKDDKSIVGVAKKAGKFKTLLAAAEAAGLVETLSGEGPLTVFAPTDEAFAALPKGTIKTLLKPANRDQLATILKYHVIAGKVSATDAVKAGNAKTVAGENVRISINGGSLTINDSKVITNDVETSNGIIHIIDKVLLPPTDNKDSHSRNTRKKEITITSNWSNPVNKDGVEADKITIRVSGGGSVKLTNVSADQVVTTISGGGTASIAGSVCNHNARVNGGAVLKARDLVTSKTKILVNGGGIAEVNSQDTLNVTANGGAKVRYVDTDAKITKHISRYADFAKVH